MAAYKKILVKVAACILENRREENRGEVSWASIANEMEDIRARDWMESYGIPAGQMRWITVENIHSAVAELLQRELAKGGK